MPTREELNRINAEVNKLPYVAELTDDWRPIDQWGGDCDSFATAKMLALYKAGWRVTDMRLAECEIPSGGSHCVLLVDCDGETYALDNRRPVPVLMEQTGYTFTRIQVAGTPNWEVA